MTAMSDALRAAGLPVKRQIPSHVCPSLVVRHTQRITHINGLTDGDVQAIRKAHLEYGISIHDLADEWNRAYQTIWRIVTNRTHRKAA